MWLRNEMRLQVRLPGRQAVQVREKLPVQMRLRQMKGRNEQR